nr:MAG TPA: hypothetical protein [Bacteriophage sp.]
MASGGSKTLLKGKGLDVFPCGILLVALPT